MNKIGEIMTLLDWTRSETDQNRGIEMAKGLKNLGPFLQPVASEYNKNVWENCAKIICSRSDAEITPYLPGLLQWIEDLNWPGALLILDRLTDYSDREKLRVELKRCYSLAEMTKDEIWKSNLNELNSKLSSTD